MTPSTVDRWLLVGGLVAALAAAGCGTVPGTAVPAPTTTTTTTTAPPPTAADGADYAACADGTCEVALTGPVDIAVGSSTGPGTFKVLAVREDGIEFDVDLPHSGGHGTLKGYCTLTFTPGGGGSRCSNQPLPPPQPQTGVLAVQLVGVTGGTAVVRLVTG
ncbi:hypothetical protein LZG04_14620 [Saccharothrix sp. S26]|uniref:hypothetical protein n=1 Tax=Saccharothrix sp. S26 TaxID=2907215 RepID=UPI001F3463BF|nr:hypothetical protein [Saccharothrix sp. S26]MCE6996028.1 hypothetical protein [Saccharothrix sp. S26]